MVVRIVFPKGGYLKGYPSVVTGAIWQVCCRVHVRVFLNLCRMVQISLCINNMTYKSSNEKNSSGFEYDGWRCSVFRKYLNVGRAWVNDEKRR